MKSRSGKRTIIENITAIAFTQAANYIMPLISLPYLSRVLGGEKFGLVFWAQSCIQYFMLITDYGFNWSATREISLCCRGGGVDNKKISDIFNAILCTKFILMLICFVILNIIIVALPPCRGEWLLFYLTFFMVVGYIIYPVWYFQGIEHMKYVTFLKIASQGVFIILILIFVKKEADYLYVALFNSLGFMVAGIISIISAVKRFKLKLYFPRLSDVKYQFKYSFDFFVSNVSSALYSNTNSFVLGLITTPVYVGYYAAAEKIFAALHMLSSPIPTAFYPYISKTGKIEAYKKCIYIMLPIFYLFALCVFYFAKDIVIFVYGKNMLFAYHILRIFCLTVCVSVSNTLVGYPLLGALGYTSYVNKSVTIAGIAHVLAIAVLYSLNLLNIWSLSFLTALPHAIMLSSRICGIIKYKIWNKKENVC